MGRQPAIAVDYSEYSPTELEKMAHEARDRLNRIEQARAASEEEACKNALKAYADTKEWNALVKRINDMSDLLDKQKSGFTVRIPCELVVSVPNELDMSALQTMLQSDTCDLTSADGEALFPLELDDIELVTASKNKLFRSIVQEITFEAFDSRDIGLDIARTYPEMRKVLNQVEKLHEDCHNFADDVYEKTRDVSQTVWPEEVIRQMIDGLDD